MTGMMDLMRGDELLAGTQFAIGVLFLVTCLAKCKSPAVFVEGRIDYKILPSIRLAWPVAITIIVVEFLIAVSHLLGWMLSAVAPMSIGLLVVFLMAVITVLRRGDLVPCSCFGSSRSDTVSSRTVLQILSLLLAEVVVVRYAPGSVVTADLGLLVYVSQLVMGCVVLLAATWTFRVREMLELFKTFGQRSR